MKISSASKKVLASALSAAMVVAFAPTVAFGAVNEGDTVKVKFDTTGLTLQNGSSPFTEDTYRVGAGNVVDLGSSFAANHVYKSGDNEIQWYYDANDNGELDGTEAAITDGKFTIDPATDLTDGTVTLKANVVTDFTVSGTPSAAPGWYAPYKGYTGLWFGTTIAEAGIYSATLSKDGAEIASLPLANVTAGGTLGSFTFVDALDDGHKASDGYIAKDTFGEGTYTLTVTNAAGKKVSKSFTVVKVSLSGIFGTAGSEVNGQTVYAYKGQTLHTALTGFSSSSVFGQDASAVKYVNGVAKKATAYTLNGSTVETLSGDTLTEAVETTLKGDVVLGTVYEDEVDPTLALSGKSVTLKLGNVDSSTKYKAVVTVNGTEYPTTDTGSNWNTAKEIYSFGTAGAQGGTYNVVVYKLTAAGTGTIEEKVAEKAIDLASITLDAGEGKLAAGQKADLGVFQAGTSYRSTVLTGVADPTPNDKTAKFLGWSLDGTSVLKTADKVAAGTASVTLKAVYSSVKASAPAYEWANDSLTLANTAGDGYKVVYSYSSNGGASYGSQTDYTGPIQLKKGANGAVKAKIVKTAANTSGKADSAEIVITNSNAAKVSLDSAISSLGLTATATTSDSTANAPKYYATVLKDQIAAAKAVVTDKAFASADDWGKIVKEQTGAALKLVADYETAQIDALAAGVKASDGSMKKIGSAAADKQKAAVAQVVTDWTYVNDDNNKTVASKTYSNYVEAITKAAKDAASAAVTYKAADVTAAEAVTKQLREAKTADAANAALKAYNELTSTQKELVATADVKAAQDVVTKAELAEAQDEAAIAKVKGKTVKAKAKKKTTAKLTVVTSKSGAKSTFKKASGNAKITVSKGGKVTVKKGLKAGKTYTAKVKATVGTQTKTVKVVVKVSK